MELRLTFLVVGHCAFSMSCFLLPLLLERVFWGLGKKKKKKVDGSPSFSRERKIKDQHQGHSPDG